VHQPGLPSQLKVGDICMAAPGSPPFARFKNVTPVTVPVRPPFGQALHWRLISHLALNYRALADRQSLRAILDLYNFLARSTGRPRAPTGCASRASARCARAPSSGW
jgi:type VI protein secretion system component VasA